MCYVEDILIFPKNIEEYEEYVKLVLQNLQNVGLYVKLEKCVFHQLQVEFF